MSGDYGGFRAIIDEARDLEREAREEEILACPICGEPLDENSAGVKNCPLGHFRTSARTVEGFVA